MKQITWDANGGHTMKDDDMMDEIVLDNFGVDNAEDLDDMTINLGTPQHEPWCIQ